ncbi:MAG: stimulus-sensing domain-containing protein [Rhodoblastus sp.]
MSVEAHSEQVVRPMRRLKRLVRLRQLWRGTLARFSSSLTRRIIVLNLGGLFALLLGFLYLNQFRAGLIDARLQSLQIQGEIIAAAIASSATVETDSIAIDPEKLLQLAPGQSYGPSDEASPSIEFSINPDRIGPLLHRLVSPTRTRARVYDRDGYMLLDSRSLTSRSLIVPSDLPPVGDKPGLWESIWAQFKRLYGPAGSSGEIEANLGDGRVYPEVAHALSGSAGSVVRVNDLGETVVSVAVPIQRFRAVRGALLLSTRGGDIDKIIASERWAIVRIFLVSASVMLLLSLFFAGTIAEPIRRLAEAAERVRRGGKARHEIPDFSDRSDEIGHLSVALRDMTGSLYLRIEAIESFAADVAHELKNPLTSLRSAVETLPIAKTDTSRKRLLEVIEHDVRRLDRLISDISDASRLDAELARFDMAEVDISAVLQAVVGVAQGVDRGDGVRVQFDLAAAPASESGRKPWRVLGHDSRLGQVFNNLVDNARSFSEPGGTVRVSLRPARGPGANGGRDGYEAIVDDDGPGIPAHAFERIFERFYTDRPNQGFGQNSGLGLSISRQIVEAHNGRIRAMNRTDPKDPEKPLGARFTVWLPAAP